MKIRRDSNNMTIRRQEKTKIRRTATTDFIKENITNSTRSNENLTGVSEGVHMAVKGGSSGAKAAKSISTAAKKGGQVTGAVVMALLEKHDMKHPSDAVLVGLSVTEKKGLANDVAKELNKDAAKEMTKNKTIKEYRAKTMTQSSVSGGVASDGVKLNLSSEQHSNISSVLPDIKDKSTKLGVVGGGGSVGSVGSMGAVKQGLAGKYAGLSSAAGKKLQDKAANKAKEIKKRGVYNKKKQGLKLAKSVFMAAGGEGSGTDILRSLGSLGIAKITANLKAMVLKALAAVASALLPLLPLIAAIALIASIISWLFGAVGNEQNFAYVDWAEKFSTEKIEYKGMTIEHGYSQGNRTLGTDWTSYGGVGKDNPDVDCSSFVWYALANSDFDKKILGSGPFSTANMGDTLVSLGFTKYDYDPSTIDKNLQRGDILWFRNGDQGHTEIYCGDHKMVGAHSNHDGKTGDMSGGGEVSVGNFSASRWQCYYRPPATDGGGEPTTTDLHWNDDWFKMSETEFMNKWTPRLNKYLSDAPENGLKNHGADFAAAAWKYKIDPRLSAAISGMESSKGQFCFKHCNAWGWGNSSWPDWKTAIFGHADGLKRGYWGLTLRQIQQKYCPVGAANDLNGTNGQWYGGVSKFLKQI